MLTVLLRSGWRLFVLPLIAWALARLWQLHGGLPAPSRTIADRAAPMPTVPAAPPAHWPSRAALVVPPARQSHHSTLIMLHGLGDSGQGWAFLARELAADLPHTAFIFPHAPQRPIARFDGQPAAAWFDISATPGQADRQGLMGSLRYLEGLVEEQAAAGIPSERVVVGGFSQGGAVALLALRLPLRLAGVLALSTFLPLPEEAPLVSDANRAAPILMCHGDADTMITLDRAQRSVEGLRGSAALLDFRAYSGLAHSVNAEEMEDVRRFLRSRLAQG